MNLRPSFAWSIRSRITLISSVVVGLVLTIAAVALVRLQVRALDNSIDAGLAVRASDIEAQIRSGSLDPAPGVGDEEIAAIQVISSSGAVVAASANLAGQPAIAAGAPADAKDRVTVIAALPFEDEQFRVLARPVEGPDGAFTILVAGSRDDATESAAALAGLLWVGVPLVTAIATAGTWLLVGRALRPVEAIRREVERIEASQLQRRVPAARGNDEVARLAGTMNDMLARVESAYSRQQTFVADAAHELRSPLASLRAQLEAGSPEEEDILAEVVRLQRLANDLLLLASAGVPRSTAEAAWPLLDLDDAVFEEVRRARPLTRATFDCSGVSAAAVRGDLGQLARVVQNLLENAVRHAESEIRVALIADDREVVLSVADDGPGVGAADRERIFERFARSDSGRSRDSGGAGLGLAITRAIVERHGGSVALDADFGPGARFLVRLPAATPVEAGRTNRSDRPPLPLREPPDA